MENEQKNKKKNYKNFKKVECLAKRLGWKTNFKDGNLILKYISSSGEVIILKFEINDKNSNKSIYEQIDACVENYNIDAECEYLIKKDIRPYINCTDEGVLKSCEEHYEIIKTLNNKIKRYEDIDIFPKPDKYGICMHFYNKNDPMYLCDIVYNQNENKYGLLFNDYTIYKEEYRDFIDALKKAKELGFQEI